MRRGNPLVFDEYLVTGTTVITNQELNALLAQYDQLSVFAVVDNPGGAGTLTVALFHSGDGRNWVQKATNLIGAGGATGAFAAGATTALTGVDNGVLPTLAFAQLQVSVATYNAHVRIHVTTRDPSL